MKKRISLLFSSFVGIIFGVLSTHSILAGSWLNLAVWAVVGLLIGFFIEEKIYVKSSGVFYGLFLTLSFLISGFQGTSDKIFGFGLLTLVLSIIGAFCGWCWVFIGYWIKGKFR